MSGSTQVRELANAFQLTQADFGALAKMGRVLKLVEPKTTMFVGTNEEGDPYVHFGTPDGAVDYFIEPHGDTWEGKHRGRIGMPAIRRHTVAGVAMAAATVLSQWLAGIASTAAGIVASGGC